MNYAMSNSRNFCRIFDHAVLRCIRYFVTSFNATEWSLISISSEVEYDLQIYNGLFPNAARFVQPTLKPGLLPKAFLSIEILMKNFRNLLLIFFHFIVII